MFPVFKIQSAQQNQSESEPLEHDRQAFIFRYLPLYAIHAMYMYIFFFTSKPPTAELVSIVSGMFYCVEKSIS